MGNHDNDHPVFKGQGRDWVATLIGAAIVLVLGGCMFSMIADGYGYAWAGLGLLAVRLFFFAFATLGLVAALICVGVAIYRLSQGQRYAAAVMFILAIVLVLTWAIAASVLGWLTPFNFDPHGNWEG